MVTELGYHGLVCSRFLASHDQHSDKIILHVCERHPRWREAIDTIVGLGGAHRSGPAWELPNEAALAEFERRFAEDTDWNLGYIFAPKDAKSLPIKRSDVPKSWPGRVVIGVRQSGHYLEFDPSDPESEIAARYRAARDHYMAHAFRPSE